MNEPEMRREITFKYLTLSVPSKLISATPSVTRICTERSYGDDRVKRRAYVQIRANGQAYLQIRSEFCSSQFVDANNKRPGALRVLFDLV